ncbi:putative ferric-chelate reductase 1 homolog [Homalodisca vitripennis]|uniref:putative ferric-chelate reductase 1 homolog n=1 Tax=Homalodisca vitripennis TaxID=197043 RepID=UPI001EEC886D|nr:putative ferric-chelate reductase 1 homolog [Homalodisca vitripennis]
MQRWTVVWCLCLAGARLAGGFSGGAPSSTCEEMVPKHRNTAAQNSQSMYTVASSHPHTQDGKVRVMISAPEGAAGAAPGFAGFLVEARSPQETAALGTFTSVPEEAQTIDCAPGQSNAATHRSGLLKQAVELEWEAPPDWEGDINFVATVVSNYTTYWVGVKSEPVRVIRRQVEGGPPGGISTTKAPATVTVEDILSSEMQLYAGCGSSKSCVGSPLGCIETKSCDAVVAVTSSSSGGGYTIDMVGKQVKYVAVGFSDDTVMGSDHVIECVHEDNDAENGVKAYRSWNLPGTKSNRREERQSGFSLMRGVYLDGTVYCRVHHEAVVTVQDKTFNLDKTPYNLLLAAGSELKANSVGFHNKAYVSSADKQLMSDFRVITPPDPFYDGCNEIKTCFGAPGDCVASRDCLAVASVLTQGLRYQFEMKAKAAGYVALGLSDDRFMGSDSVVECVHDPSSVSGPIKAYMSWNVPLPNKGNIRKSVPQEGMTLLNGSYTDGTIYCRLSRDLVTTVEGTTFNLAQDQYYLLLAAGSSLKSESVGFHDVIYVASGQKAALTDVGGFTEASRLLLKLHGALMVAAWIGAASLGIVMARYYRQTWVTSSFCGKDIWFAWHRFLMLMVWLLTLTGAVLIVVEVGGWVSEASVVHALLGSATTLLCFIQPFMALIRPHPGASGRQLFNWAHWFVGNTAHILAIVTIFLAVQLNKAELPQWMDWVLVGYVAFYVIVHLILSMCGCVSERAGSKRINTFPMKDMNSGRVPLSMDRKQDAPHAGLRKCLLVILVLGVVAIATFLILLVVFAPFERSWAQFQESLKSM